MRGFSPNMRLGVRAPHPARISLRSIASHPLPASRGEGHLRRRSSFSHEQPRADRLPRRRTDGTRHRGRVRLCGAPGRAGRFQAARRGRVREAVRRGAGRSAQRARHARELRPVRRQRMSTASRRASRSCRSTQARGRARRRPTSSSKACPRCSISSARRWRARRSSPGRSRSSPRPRRPSWSTICQARSSTPSVSSTRTGSIRRSWCRWSKSRPASTPIRPSPNA